MSLDNWQKENTPDPFNGWQESNQTAQTTHGRLVEPGVARENAGQIWDIAQAAEIVVSDAEALFNATEPQKPQVSDGLIKRFGKQFWNSAVANVAQAFGTQSTPGKIKQDVLTIGGMRDEVKQRYEAGEPLTQQEIEHYAKKEYRRGTMGSMFGMKPDQWQVDLWDKWQAGELEVQSPRSPEEELMRFATAEQQAQFKAHQAADIGFDVPRSEGFAESATDVIAGIAGFTAQIATMKKLAPSMPEWLVWENVNIANGGKPGSGAAMQVTMGGVGQMFPGAGYIPALKRGATSSVLFGTSTYLGGGDTEDILISMGVPFAFQAIGLTKQGWATYKNKKSLIDALRMKAPALRNLSDVEIERAIAANLTNIPPTGRTAQQMKQQFVKKPFAEEISTQVRNYMQRQQYDQLLAKANAGDKKAISQLNDLIQGRNIPTYEALLNKVYNGDQNAMTQIQLGQYQGGPGAAQAVAPTPKPKKIGADFKEPYKPKTPIDRIREQEVVVKNDMRPPEKIDPKDLSKARERGFITSVKEVMPELKIEGQYIPRSTDRLGIKAKNLVVDDIAAAEKIARSGMSDKAVATAAELSKHYHRKALSAKTEADKDYYFEKAASVVNQIAVVLTESGRTSQAAHLISLQTPEGQLRFAARTIQKYNEQVEQGKLTGPRRKIPELTGEQTEYILKEMRAIERMVEGKDRFMRFQKLQDHVGRLVPTPLYDKVITVWKAGLLTGIKTTGLNIYSNAGHLGSETVKDIPASVVDIMVSFFTGKRTVTPTFKGLDKGTVDGIGKGLEYLRSGYSERDIGVKLDYNKTYYNTRALQMYTEGVFRNLGAQDQPFYYAAKARSMFQQAQVSAMNLGLKGKAAQAHVDQLMKNPTEKMIKYATKDAEAAVFINSTGLGEVAKAIQRIPGGEVIVPFGRTPAAVATQIINYSPVGIPKTIIENIGKGRFDQRAFSQGMGRSITGTAVLAIGTHLYDSDMITLDRPRSEKERKLWELEGRQANSIKIGGKWRSVHTLGPIGNLLVIGGHFRRAYMETGSPTEALAEATMGSAKSFTEQTFLTGVNQFTEALVDPDRSAAYVAGRTISTIIPTIVADVARATDPVERRTETIPEQVATRVPGLRQTLEPRITALGEEKTPTANPIELMIDPTRPSKQISTPVVDELRRLWDAGWEASPALIGDRKGFEPLSQQENTELWKRAGTLTKDSLTQLVTADWYKGLGDEAKFDYINQLVNESRRVAKIEMVIKKLQGLEGKEETDMIFELRKSGLADTEILPIALSRRNVRAVLKEQKK